MINTFDINAGMRKSDIIFDGINGLYDRKKTGVLSQDELSKILINIGDVFANLIKQGKVSEDIIASYESHLTQFLGVNKNSFFNYPHKDLDRATKSNLQSIDFAKEEMEKRNSYAQPVMDSGSYERTFRRLGN